MVLPAGFQQNIKLLIYKLKCFKNIDHDFFNYCLLDHLYVRYPFLSFMTC